MSLTLFPVFKHDVPQQLCERFDGVEWADAIYGSVDRLCKNQSIRSLSEFVLELSGDPADAFPASGVPTFFLIDDALSVIESMRMRFAAHPEWAKEGRNVEEFADWLSECRKYTDGFYLGLV